MSYRIHIFGASGSGTTTLGRALANHLGCPHLDTDDYFWELTAPPFQKPRDRADRQARLSKDLSAKSAWVLSGSLCGWGDIFIPLFDVAVFLSAPTELRLARLRDRERDRYGNVAIAAGGIMNKSHLEFMSWASAYDTGSVPMRCRQLHEQWIRELPCPIMRLDGSKPINWNREDYGDAQLGRQLWPPIAICGAVWTCQDDLVSVEVT